MAVKLVYAISGAVLVVTSVGIILGVTLGLRRNKVGSVNPAALPPRPGHAADTTPSASKSASGNYRYAAVAADATECSTIGVDVMARKRGSAVDAAVATMFCVGILNFQSTGIGGGHFMTIYDTPRGETAKRMITIDGRDVAAIAAHRDMFVNHTDLAKRGGLSIATPGDLAGMHKAWTMFGTVPWADLVQPSIDLCTEGHRVTHATAAAVAEEEESIRGDANLRELLVKSNGELVQAGDVIKRPKMAATLQRVADYPYTFYNGSLAREIIEDIIEYDGILTLQDLEHYKALVKEPLNVSLSNGDYTVYATRPPGGGATFQFILGILNGYMLNADSVSTLENRILTYHRIVEAFKFAYAKRSALGDEDYLGQELQDLVRNMTSSDYAEATRLLINDTYTQNVSYYGPSFGQLEDDGTAHLSVLAPDGSAVAMTGSINLYFGSHVRGSRTGIFFNNHMDDFSTPGTKNYFGVPASPSNFIEPGKRPQSSMTPTLFLDAQGEIVHIVGGEGGTKITTGTTFVTMNNLWFGKPLVNSVDEDRIHHQLVPEVIQYEANLEQALVEGLEKKGHQTEKLAPNSQLADVMPITSTCSTCNDTSCRMQCIHAVTDYRKPSAPDGF